jgi:methylase of polypeptide subunit release factors
MQISGSSLELANLINPRHALKALDLGTGCGFLATLVSPQAERVYAVDLSPAAVRLAEFNARWNALSNIACLQGDLFGPVRGLRFDLIVCNPPFFICPVADAEMNRLIFQHSGQQGDTFCVQLARDACEFLEEDGFFHMMFSWMQKDGQDWRARLEPAFTGIGCDVWCLRIDERSAEDYVWAWCAGLEEIPGADLDDLRRKAMAYFQKENVSAIGTGLLTLRRRTSRPNQLWFDDAPEDRSEPYGDSVANLFEVRVNVGSLPDAELLRQKVTCAPDLGIVRKSTRKGRRWEVIASEFCCNSGLKYTFEGIDDPLVEIVNQLDGHSSLREILTKVARKRREPVNRLVRAYLPTLRELLWYGFVLPAPTVRSASRSGKPTRRSAR